MQALAVQVEEDNGGASSQAPPVPLIWRHFHLYHLFFFILLSIVGGLVLSLLLSCNPIDGFFTATSALSLTGLMTLDSSQLTATAKALLVLFMCLGSTLFVSLVPLIINYFTLRRAKSRDGISLSPSRDVYLEQTALAKLLLIVPAFFLLHTLFAYVLLVIYSLLSVDMQAQLAEDRLNPWSANLFLVVSAITNAGISPFSDSLLSLQKLSFPLLLVAYLTFAGNVGFPILLRLIIIIRTKLSERFSVKDNQAYAVLLEHPRSFYTHLFDHSGTKDLVLVTTCLVVGQTAFTLLFEWSRTLGKVSFPLKFINAYAKSLFEIPAYVSLTALQVMQLALMFLSSLPVALSIISSSISFASSSSSSRREAVKQSFLHTIQFDLLFLCVALFMVAAIEAAGESPINLWRTLYEVVSAYGTVGLSLSPVTQSFCATFSAPAKLVLIVVMIAGRMRALGLGSMKLIMSPHHALSVPSDSADYLNSFELQDRTLPDDTL